MPNGMMTANRSLLALLAGVLALLITPAAAADSPNWTKTKLGRIEAFALLESLEIELLSHDSATLTLDDWCSRHHIEATDSKIIAERVAGVDKPASAEQRRLLGVGEEEPIRYRRVRLRCGAHILSEADNWYVPSRLTPAMNTALDTTDTAFGRVVQPLHFRRQTLSARLLWAPSPDGWDTDPPPTGGMSSGRKVPDHVIENRASLVLGDGTPFSEVIESYTSEVLDFTPPKLAR